MMVGDGLNDGPALAAADIAIAVDSGTDLAMECSDIVLVDDDLHAIDRALRLSAATMRTVRGNLAWAFAYNLVAVPFAAVGVLSPMYAAAAMASSSLLVMANSLRLRRFREAPPVHGDFTFERMSSVDRRPDLIDRLDASRPLTTVLSGSRQPSPAPSRSSIPT